jgi:outer membrane protein TolC
MKRSNFFGGRLCSIVVASNLTALSWAMAEPSLYVSYRSIPLRIEKHNPDLQAARLHIDEAIGRNVQSGRLSNPVAGAQVGTQNGLRERSLTLGLTQSFPLTNRLRLEKEVTRQDLEAARVEVADVKRRIIGDARQALIRLLVVREQLSLRQDQIAPAETLEKSLRDSAAKGEVSALDAGLVKLEVMQLQTEVRQLEARQKAINGELKPLLGLPVEKPVNVGDPFKKLGGMDVTEENVLARADLRAARLRIGEAQAQADLERANKYSDLQVRVFAGMGREEDEPIGFENESIAGVASLSG